MNSVLNNIYNSDIHRYKGFICTNTTLFYLLRCHKVAVSVLIVEHGGEEVRPCKDTVSLIEQSEDEHDQCELESWRRVIIHRTEDDVEQYAEEAKHNVAERRASLFAEGAVGAPETQHYVVAGEGVLRADLCQHAEEDQEPARTLHLVRPFLDLGVHFAQHKS